MGIQPQRGHDRWPSGPGDQTGSEIEAGLARHAGDTAMVDAAERSVRAFGGPDLDRFRAATLIGLWSQRGSLSADQVTAVLRRFPAAAVQR